MDNHQTSRCVALVPLRGGSKSIPLKNIKPIAGKPLCIWSLSAAVEAGVFDEVIVSTDDERIAAVVRKHLPTVCIVERPAEFATDSATTESVMHHVADFVSFDLLCTIQATSPLTTADDLRGAMSQFRETAADSLLTAVRTKRFFWNDDGTPINYDPRRRPRRQDFAGTLMENGAFYLTTRAILSKTGSRLGGRITVFEMHEDTAAEIDEPADWDVIERLLLQRGEDAHAPRSFTQRAAAMEWIFFDVDGTLTDGGMYYTADGEFLKRFSTRDGMGLRLLREAGCNVGIITSEDSDVARARARKLGIETVFAGVGDKAQVLREFAVARGVDLAHIGLMGDDLNDLTAMQLVGLAACPADAVETIRANAHFVSTARGGYGAVRELCDAVIAAR